MHINLQDDSLVRYTKLSKQEQKKLINWFSRQNIAVQIDIFEEQKNQFFKLKSDCREVQIVPLAAFLLAIQYFYSLVFSKNNKNKQDNLNGSAKISMFTIKKAKKIRKKEKREKLLNLWSIIIDLREEGFSFREISEHLKGRHRLNVSHTYIINLWKELEDG
ncbi:MAG: hypothetical protein QM497_05805 [Sulfurimonas sp.]